MSSMLGWVAAVTDTESPSQLSPAVIQRTWISVTAGAGWVFRPAGASVAVAMGEATFLGGRSAAEGQSGLRLGIGPAVLQECHEHDTAEGVAQRGPEEE